MSKRIKILTTAIATIAMQSEFSDIDDFTVDSESHTGHKFHDDHAKSDRSRKVRRKAGRDARRRRNPR